MLDETAGLKDKELDNEGKGLLSISQITHGEHPLSLGQTSLWNQFFQVVVVQMNGHDHPSESVHIFHVGKLRIKLRKGRSTKAKESYSTSMQLCGLRGGGGAAAYTYAPTTLASVRDFWTLRYMNNPSKSTIEARIK